MTGELNCADCGSEEISWPSLSDPYYLCADCGRAWPLAGFEVVFERHFPRIVFAGSDLPVHDAARYL